MTIEKPILVRQITTDQEESSGWATPVKPLAIEFLGIAAIASSCAVPPSAATPEPVTAPKAVEGATSTPGAENTLEVVPTPLPERIPTPPVGVTILNAKGDTRTLDPETSGVDYIYLGGNLPPSTIETDQYTFLPTGEELGQYNIETGELVLGTTISVPVGPAFGLKDGAGRIVVAILKEKLQEAIAHAVIPLVSTGVSVALSVSLVGELAVGPPGMSAQSSVELLAMGPRQQVLVNEKGDVIIVNLNTGEELVVMVNPESTADALNGTSGLSSREHTNCIYNWTSAQMRAIRDGAMKVYFVTESGGVAINHAYGIWNGRVIMPRGMYYTPTPSLTPQEILSAKEAGTAADITEAVNRDLARCDYSPPTWGD